VGNFGRQVTVIVVWQAVDVDQSGYQAPGWVDVRVLS
jgi:hypothetical protein